jgi:hypothetical protein
MDHIQRYGVFRLGQIWSVVGDRGLSLGFPTRDRALSAAHAMVSFERASGNGAELVVQDELGTITTIANPA